MICTRPRYRQTFVDIIEKGGDLVDYADAETTRNNWLKEYNQLYPLVEALEKEKK